MEKIELTLPVHFFSAGQFIAPQRWIHPKRQIDTSVLFLVERGHFVIWEDDCRMEVGAHETVILRAGHTHYGEFDPKGELPNYYWAHFLPGTREDAEADLHRIQLDQHASCKNYETAVVFFHQLINESRSPRALPLASDYLMSLILIQLTRCERTQAPQTLYSRMQEYLNMNYHFNITLHQLAHVFPYSADYLSRVFKKNAGISIRTYIHMLRLEEAKRRLLSSMDSINQIANDCGYTNEKFFATTFLKYEGITPTQYRMRFSKYHQNNDM